MKTLILAFAILLIATSCDVYYVEPVVAVPVYDPRDQYIGSYDVNEYSSTYDEYWEYGLSIYKSEYNIVISNFYNSGLTIDANVNGDNIYIPWQTVNGYELQGDGYIENGKITINYKVRDTYAGNLVWDFCTATGFR